MINKKLFSNLMIVSFLVNVECLASCDSRSKCIEVKKCLFVYDLLNYQPGLYSPESLRCDDTESVLKVCCPPIFQNSRLNNSRSNSRINNAAMSLPDTDVCGIQHVRGGSRILGGNITAMTEFPWMALLRYDKPDGWDFECGGVLITSRHVLTAAHCLKGFVLPSNWTLRNVRLGEWNISSEKDCIDGYCMKEPLDIEVEQKIIHEDFDGEDTNLRNDIAILKLARDVPFDDFKRPICLPLTEDEQTMSYDGHNLVVAGFGTTEAGSYSNVKIKANVPLVNHSVCTNLYKTKDAEVTDKQICAGGLKGVDSCKGDSGSPLMRMRSTGNWVSVGIVSYGRTECGTPDWPGIYTRISHYTDWIKEHLL